MGSTAFSLPKLSQYHCNLDCNTISLCSVQQSAPSPSQRNRKINVLAQTTTPPKLLAKQQGSVRLLSSKTEKSSGQCIKKSIKRTVDPSHPNSIQHLKSYAGSSETRPFKTLAGHKLGTENTGSWSTLGRQSNGLNKQLIAQHNNNHISSTRNGLRILNGSRALTDINTNLQTKNVRQSIESNQIRDTNDKSTVIAKSLPGSSVVGLQQNGSVRDSRLSTFRQRHTFQLLSPEAVLNAVETLYKDRIRPLLIDVVQRIKFRARKTVQDNFEKYATSTEQESKDKSIEEKENEHPFGTTLQDALKHINCLDVYALYNFIQGKCKTDIRIKYPVDNWDIISQLDYYKHVRELKKENCLQHTHLIAMVGQLEAELIYPSDPILEWVDPHSSSNPYSDIIWRSLCTFLIDRLRANDSDNIINGGLMPYQFKGGRYGLAVELQKSNYISLQTLSLGELCHLVQLGITGGLLAYERSVLQPVASCTELSGVLLRLGRRFDSHVVSTNEKEPSHCSYSTPIKTYTNHLKDYHWPLLGTDSEIETEKKPITLLSFTEDNHMQQEIINTPHDNSLTHSSLLLSSSGSENKFLNRNSFNTIEELADSLNELLQNKPEGLVIAQLKKILFTKFGKDILPERFGYRKLTECLTGNPIISRICQIISPDPSTHRLFIIHRKFLSSSTTMSGFLNPIQKKQQTLLSQSIRSPTCQSASPTGSVDTQTCPVFTCISPTTYLPCPTQQIYLPENIMNPVNSLTNISFYSWAYSKHISLSFAQPTEPVISIVSSNKKELWSGSNRSDTVYSNDLYYDEDTDADDKNDVLSRHIVNMVLNDILPTTKKSNSITHITSLSYYSNESF